MTSAKNRAQTSGAEVATCCRLVFRVRCAHCEYRIAPSVPVLWRNNEYVLRVRRVDPHRSGRLIPYSCGKITTAQIFRLAQSKTYGATQIQTRHFFTILFDSFSLA